MTRQMQLKNEPPPISREQHDRIRKQLGRKNCLTTHYARLLIRRNAWLERECRRLKRQIED